MTSSIFKQAPWCHSAIKLGVSLLFSTTLFSAENPPLALSTAHLSDTIGTTVNHEFNTSLMVLADATVQESPPQITINIHTPAVLTIHRRLLGDGAWVQQATVTATDTTWVDTNVVVGVAYEYWLTGSSIHGSGWQYPDSPPHASYYNGEFTRDGYIAAGIRVDQAVDKGRMILVVDQTNADGLSYEIDRFKKDLIGDGWRIDYLESARGSGTSDGAGAELLKGALVNPAVGTIRNLDSTS